MCGLPGAGKTTLARELESQGAGLRLCPDEWMRALGFDLYDAAARDRVEGLQRTLAMRLLAQGTSVILENGFWSATERNDYRSSAAAAGAASQVHFLDVPLAELERRIVARNAERDATGRVDPADLAGWHAVFEAPSADELS